MGCGSKFKENFIVDGGQFTVGYIGDELVGSGVIS